MPTMRRFSILYCLGLVVAAAMACAEEAQEIQYQSVLEATGQKIAESMPDAWTLVSLTDSGEQPAAEGAWRIGEDGTLAIAPGEHPLVLRSPVLPVDASCVSLAGVALGSGAHQAEARLHWLEAGVLIDAVVLREPPASSAASRRFTLTDVERPAGADAAQLVLYVAPGAAGAFHCATIRITGAFSAVRSTALFVNRLGYEQMEPKSFVAYANFPADRARFVLNDPMGARVFEGELSRGERVQSGDSEWEGMYYRGDFSGWQKEGDFTLVVSLDDEPPLTAPIRIGFNLFWEEAFVPALAPFKQFRTATTPGADTPPELWNSAVAGGGSQAQLLWDIVRSWSILQGRFQDTPEFAPLQEEALYGLEIAAAWTLARQEAGGDVLTEPLFAAALACGARHYRESAQIRDAAFVACDAIMARNLRGVLPFSVVMDLHGIDGRADLLEYGKKIFPGVSMTRVEPLLDYEDHTGEMVSIPLAHLFNKTGEQIINRTRNPFGLPCGLTAERPGFFLWGGDAEDPLRGGSRPLLELVEVMAQAHRYAAVPAFRVFVYDQFNWLMGCNPFGECLVAGLDPGCEPPVAVPAGMERRQLYGAVLHGIGPQSAVADLPAFCVDHDAPAQESTNGFSLNNNARYISALAYLKRIPVVRPPRSAL